MRRVVLAVLVVVLAYFAPVSGLAPRPEPAIQHVAIEGHVLLPRGTHLDVLDLASGQEHSLLSGDDSADAGDDTIVSVNLGAAWAPDGDRVAVVQFSTGPGLLEDESRLQVLDHGQILPLASRQARSEMLSSPVWTADGRSVIYQVSGAGGSNTYLEAAALDGTGGTVIERGAAEPALSIDGAELAFVRATGDSSAILIRSLVDGDKSREIVPAGAFTGIWSPRFSPDGRRLAFLGVGGPSGSPRPPGRVGLSMLNLRATTAEAHGVHGDPWVVNIDGRGLRPLPDPEMNDATLAWVPDGSSVSILSVGGLWLVPTMGGDRPRIVASGGHGRLDWRP